MPLRWVPALAADPDFPLHVLAVSLDKQATQLYESFDLGGQWR
jgi:hypothetical protein